MYTEEAIQFNHAKPHLKSYVLTAVTHSWKMHDFIINDRSFN